MFYNIIKLLNKNYKGYLSCQAQNTHTHTYTYITLLLKCLVSVIFFKETFIQQGCIMLIKSNIKDIYTKLLTYSSKIQEINVTTKMFYTKILII